MSAVPDAFDFRDEETLWAEELTRNAHEYLAAVRQAAPRATTLDSPAGDPLDVLLEVRRVRARSRILIEQSRALCSLSNAVRAASRALRQRMAAESKDGESSFRT